MGADNDRGRGREVFVKKGHLNSHVKGGWVKSL